MVFFRKFGTFFIFLSIYAILQNESVYKIVSMMLQWNNISCSQHYVLIRQMVIYIREAINKQEVGDDLRAEPPPVS